VYTVPAPSGGSEGVGAAFAAGIEQAILRMQADGVRPAALLVDTLFTSDGVYGAPAGFLQAAVACAHAAGMLVIADEVQPGFGRTGSHMWGYQRHGIAPDLVTMGKPMGNGHPLAGLCARQDLLDAFGRETRYFNTFGGNTVSAAVGMAVLDVLEGERLLENAHAQGAYFSQCLQTLARRHAWIGEVRQFGLFLGVALVHDGDPARPAAAATTRVVNGMKDRGVLISACSRSANVLKIRPPLVLERAQVDVFIEALDDCLRGLSAS
jgi:4-aminobutyrate aminotransferase-like enzyme